MSGRSDDDVVLKAMALIGERCPRLVGCCYWAGTSSISMEELHHRRSFDIDFHTRKAHLNTTPLLGELQAAFPDSFKVLRVPDEYGSGFQGVLNLPDGNAITVEVLSNYENVSDADITDSTCVTGFKRVSLVRYLADKIQCVAERSEARDLVDIMAVLRHAPGMEKEARRLMENQDAILLLERLMTWTDAAIVDDLAAYKDIESEDAKQGRDLLMKWIKDSGAGSGDVP